MRAAPRPVRERIPPPSYSTASTRNRYPGCCLLPSATVRIILHPLRAPYLLFLLASQLFAQQQNASQPNLPVAAQSEQMIVTSTYAPIPLNEADRSVEIIPIDQSTTIFRN